MDQAYLFNTGNDYHCYNMLGSKPYHEAGAIAGYRFAVWAPHAKAVSVIGDFNDWDPEANPMHLHGDTGIWLTHVPEALLWDRYKYYIHGADGRIYEKIDPCARHCETRPANASILYDPDDYHWQDSSYMKHRPQALSIRPINIYEVHLGSWRRHADGNFMNYRQIGEELALHCKEMGYTHVELMPVMEHPLDDSWGYQVTAFFAVTSRFGTPADLKYMIDHLHQAGIGVILDWVPGHFPRNLEGLVRFDGTPCYEYADPRIGEHREWGTYVFDYSKSEVRSFLISNAIYWIHEFHADGIRVDAVSSMIYRNYGRSEYIPNVNGGIDNIEAVSFLQDLNQLVRERYPQVMMIAEESTSWAKVSHPVEEGGMGFTHKWNMGWMHDTLDYFQTDYYARVWHHDQFLFSMVYAFAENFILSLSHDEVVHGKKSLLEKMPGDTWRKFASLRLLLLYMIAHPGAKLTFMGTELAPGIEWRFYEQLEWNLSTSQSNRLFKDFVAHINHFYLKKRALWIHDRSWDGFTWLDTSDKENSVFIFVRRGAQTREQVLVALNMVPVPLIDYQIPVEKPGRYRITVNSDDMEFGGSGYPVLAENQRELLAKAGEVKGQSYYLQLSLPPLAGLFIEKVSTAKSSETSGKRPSNRQKKTGDTSTKRKS